MTITAKIPYIDWDTGFIRYWNGGNPAVTHAFNALSFLFPQGEKYFIDIAKEVALKISFRINGDLQIAVRQFIAQESIHRNQHEKYNGVLKSQGYENTVSKTIDRLNLQSRRYFSPLTNLAIVCGYEHFTAILGNFILNNPQVLKPASPNMALIWGWHSAEETEHKAVCFDLYHAAGGGWVRRVIMYILVTINFNLLFGRLYFSLLKHDRQFTLSKLIPTVYTIFDFFFGWSGVAWHLIWYGLKYLSPFFHPWNQNNRSKLEAWLETNQSHLRALPGHH